MNKRIALLFLCLLAACSNTKRLSTQSTLSAQNAEAKAILDPSLGVAEKLSFNAMPPLPNERVKAGIINFTSISKAWWIGLRCQTGTPEENQDFKNRLEQLTPMMRSTLQSEFKTTPELANKYTETITMYALEEMSANKFYGCGPRAKQIWAQGYFITRLATSKAGESLVVPETK